MSNVSTNKDQRPKPNVVSTSPPRRMRSTTKDQNPMTKFLNPALQIITKDDNDHGIVLPRDQKLCLPSQRDLIEQENHINF